MGSSLPPDPAFPNFAVFDNYIQDASYLTGIIAGAMTKTGKIGVVGGFPIPEVNRLVNAFMAGVRETRPDATFQVAFIGSWFDPPKAKETAFAQIEAGADVMYAERFGVSDAAKERGVLAIGNVIDTQPDYPETVVASALWHFEPTLDAAIEAINAGVFEAAGLRRLLLHEATAAARSPRSAPSRARCPQAAMKLVAEREAAIKDGSFEVDDRRQRAEGRLRPAALDAPVVLRLDGITKRFGDASRQRRHRLRPAPGRGHRAARRERRRQDHADEHPLRPLRRRRRQRRGHGPAAPARPARAPRSRPGVGMVHQHFTLADNLTVLENIMLGTRPLWQPRPRATAARARIARPRRGASASRSTPTPASATSPSASASGSRSSRRSTATPASSSSTSRPPC